MRKILIETKSALREFSETENFMGYKEYLRCYNVKFREYIIETTQSIGLRGIAGTRYIVNRNY